MLGRLAFLLSEIGGLCRRLFASIPLGVAVRLAQPFASRSGGRPPGQSLRALVLGWSASRVVSPALCLGGGLDGPWCARREPGRCRAALAPLRPREVHVVDPPPPSFLGVVARSGRRPAQASRKNKDKSVYNA